MHLIKTTKPVLFLLLMLFSWVAANAATDYEAIDTKALAIPASKTKSTKDIAAYINESFSTDADKVRAIFIWVASNIEYDVDNMYAVNFHEKASQKIDKVLKTRKGVCEHYATLFNDICTKSGLNAQLVLGYVKNSNQLSYVPHGWSAVFLNNKWQLLDPTWGAGYVSNNKYTAKINNKYFLTDPETLIASHMPFDPIWQLLAYPITNKEFVDGRKGAKMSGTTYRFADTIAAYLQQDEITQHEAEERRMTANGLNNEMVFNRLVYLKNFVEVHRHNDSVNHLNDLLGIYNDAVRDYNESVNFLNDFINYRNKQFTPTKSDVLIQAMIDSAYTRISAAQNKVAGIKGKSATVDGMVKPVEKSFLSISTNINEQKEFLSKYFPKSKAGRKTMFFKYTR